MSEIVKVPISEVVENSENPRIIKRKQFETLVKSIQEFPEMLDVRPIVVNKEMVILGGNMRFKAALWGKVSSGDSVAVEITLDTGIVIESGYNYELVITMPNVQFTEGDIDTAVDGMMIPLVGTAFLGTSDESPITFVLQNERTTAY